MKIYSAAKIRFIFVISKHFHKKITFSPFQTPLRLTG